LWYLRKYSTPIIKAINTINDPITTPDIAPPDSLLPVPAFISVGPLFSVGFEVVVTELFSPDGFVTVALGFITGKVAVVSGKPVIPGEFLVVTGVPLITDKFTVVTGTGPIS